MTTTEADNGDRMDVEEEIFALMKAAKDQQAAVERAMAQLAKERQATGQQQAAFLQDARQVLTQFQTLRTNVATDAASAIQNAVAGVAGDVATPLKNEVQTTVTSLTSVREEIDKRVRWLQWRYIAALIIVAFAGGYLLCWYMNIHDVQEINGRLSVIEQNVGQQPTHPTTPHRGH
jgi:aspartyl-tRNA synthetase